MTTGFDELVEQLLYDVALSGSRGIGAAELSKAVTAFYKVQQKSRAKSKHVSTSETTDAAQLLFSDAPPTKATVVDEAFLDAVWDWLEKHPDVEIFADKNGQTDDAPLSSTANPAVATSATRRAEKRIFTNEDRIWQAIAGHGVDHARVPPKMFECLAVIAAHGSDGILQPDVRRITGQDKRSLPHRTDVLAKQGYITKEQVIAKSTNTTLLKLRRFAKNGATSGPQHVRAYPESKRPVAEERVLRYDAWYDGMMKLLKENGNIIALQDLLIGLGLFTKKWETRAFRRCYNRLVEAGLLRKLSARVDGTGENVEDEKWVRCIQLLREPTEIDRVWFKKNAGPGKIGKLELNARADEEANEEPDEEIEDGAEMDDEDFSDQLATTEQRIPPQWTPDVPYTNFVYNIIANAGPAGLSSMDLNERATGVFWRRPLDEIMLRLTDIWQHSQPPHLKHLSVVRDTAIQGKQAHFKFRTLENFEKAVENGDTAWEAVQQDQHSSVKTKRGRPKKDDVKMDAWGFPMLKTEDFAGGDGCASLQECHANGTEASTPRKKPGPKAQSSKTVQPSTHLAHTPNATPSRLRTVSTPTTTTTEVATPSLGQAGALRSHSTATDSTPAFTAPSSRRTVTAPITSSWRPGTTLTSNGVLSSPITPAPTAWPPGQPLNIVNVTYGANGQPVGDSTAQIHRHVANAVAKRKRKRTAKAAELDLEVEESVNKAGRFGAPGPATDASAPSFVDSPTVNSAAETNNAITLGDTTNESASLAMSKVQINPPGSYPRHLIKPGARKRVLVAVVKSTRLGSLDCFNPSAPANSLNGPAIGPRSFSAPQVLSSNHSSTPNTPQNERPAREELTQATTAKEVPQLGSADSGWSSAPTQSNKRPRDGGVEAVEREGSPLLSPQTSIQLPKRRKVGRPTKAEAAERERFKAQLAAASPATPKKSLIAKFPISPKTPQDRKQSMIVKLPVISPYHDDNAAPRLAVTATRNPPLGHQTDARRASPASPAISQQEGQSLVVKLPAPFVNPTNSSLPPSRERKDPWPVSPQSKAQVPEERNGLVVKLPLPRDAAIPRTDPIGAYATEKLPNEPGESPVDHDDTEVDMGLDGTVEVAADDEDEYVDDSEQVSGLFGVRKKYPFAQNHRTYSKAGTTRNGGIIQLRRAKIVQEIVRKAGGAFPGDHEMWYPFVTLWQRVYPQTPDRNTVEHAIDGLVQQGQLKKFGFSFEDKNGKTVQRHVIVEPHLDATSKEAKQVQNEMIKAYPYRYLPRTVQIEKHLRDKAREVPTTSATQSTEPEPEPEPGAGAATASDDGYMPDEPEEGAFPGTIPVEFPKATDVTVKRTAQGIAGPGTKEQSTPRTRTPGKRKTRMQYTPRPIAHVEDLYAPNSDSSDEEDSEADEFVSPAQAASMSSFQLQAYVHDPTAVLNKMYWPRPRETMGPRSETPAANKAFGKRLKKARRLSQTTTRRESETSAPDVIIKKPGPKPKVNKQRSRWDNLSTTPRNLEDLLERADSLEYRAADSSEPLFWQFQVEVDRVMALELALLKFEKPLLGSEQDWVSIDHGLNCPHIVNAEEMAENDIEFVEGTLSLRKAENLRRSLNKKRAIQDAEASAQRRRRLPKSTPAGASRVDMGAFAPSHASPASVQQYSPFLALPLSGAFIASPFQNSFSQMTSPSAIQKTPSPYNTRFKGQGRPNISQLLDEPDFVTPPETDIGPVSRRTVLTTVEQERLAIAIALFRILCGGAERDVTPKWELISHALAFHYTPEYAQQRWKSQARGDMGNSFVQKLETAIHEPFLEAYEKSELPTVDFNELEKTDWPGLVRWVEKTVMPLEKEVAATAMPASRRSLAEEYSVQVSPRAAEKRDENGALPIVTTSKSIPARDTSIDHNAILEKSWIRALIATDGSVYNEPQATQKLGILDQAMLDKVLDEMKHTKSITHAYKGRQQPGRNFIFMPQFYAQFNRWPGDSSTGSQFVVELSLAWTKYAAHFKAQDDLELTPNVSAAEMMILNSMLALGHVRVMPVLPTMTDDFAADPGTLSKWGMGGYSHKPKQFDESLFQLSVVYTKTSTFTTNHGLKRKVPPPTNGAAMLGEPGFRIPLWVDIHGNLVPAYWKMMLRSVLHLLVHRPGCTAQSIERAHDTKLWAWEIELALQWMAQVGVAVRCGSGKEVGGKWTGGWRAGDWWFAAFLPEVAE